MLDAVPTRSVAETPIKAPALMPPTLSGYRCPRKVKTPLPPVTPKMNPALAMWRETDPVAASAGATKAAVARPAPDRIRLRRVTLSM